MQGLILGTPYGINEVNPGHVPGFQEVIQKRLQALAADTDSFKKLIGVYDPPQGEKDFVDVLAGLLSREFKIKCVANGKEHGSTLTGIH